MALALTDGSTDKIDFGSGSTINDLSSSTYIIVVDRLSTTSGRRLLGHQDTGVGLAIYNSFFIAGDLAVGLDRATTDLDLDFDVTLSSTGLIEIAFTYSDASGGKLFARDLDGLFTEMVDSGNHGPATQGSGARDNGTSATLTLGNLASASAGYDGAFSRFKVYDTDLDINQLNAQIDANAHANLVLYSQVGLDGTNCKDLSGNGNDGTPTGAVEADHSPIRIAKPQPFTMSLATAVVSASISSVGGDDVVLDAETPAFITTGFTSEISTVQLVSGSSITNGSSVSSTSGTGTFVLPDITGYVVDTVGCPLTTANNIVVARLTDA